MENSTITAEEAQTVVAAEEKRRAAFNKYQREYQQARRQKVKEARAVLGLPALKRGRPPKAL